MNNFTLSDIFYTILVVIACLVIWYSPYWIGIVIVSMAGFFVIKSIFCIMHSTISKMEKLLLADKKQIIKEKNE